MVKENKQNSVKEPQVTMVMVTQFLKSDYWDGDLSETVETATADELLQKSIELINQGGNTNNRNVGNELTVEYGTAIIHDKDVLGNGKLKERHVHMWLRFKTKRYLSSIASWLGIEPQYIEKARRGRYAEENGLAYLIHANDSDKHQYAPEEVATYNFDYCDYVEEHASKWEKSKATNRHKKLKMNLANVLDKIQNGELTKEQMILDNDLAVLYAENKNKVENYLSVYSQRKALETIQRLESGEIQMQSYYITGGPGSGKTRYAKKLISRIQEEAFAKTGKHWRVMDGAATHSMDKYDGQEIIFLDDLRVSSMSASDWLKILDPFNSASMSARYENKPQASRVIIITSYMPPETFFFFAKGNGGQDESLDQFIRRIEAVIKVVWTGTDVSRWNDEAKVQIGRSEKLEESRIVEIPTREGRHDVVMNYGFTGGNDLIDWQEGTDYVAEHAINQTVSPAEILETNGSGE